MIKQRIIERLGMSGILYVVATPIGHLGDLTMRGVEVLNQVQIIAAEDTRRTRVLLTHIGHKGCDLLSLHEHNEDRVSSNLIKRLASGDDVALVSDAGTPLINDPGFLLLQLAWEAQIRVVPIPGACSITTALSVCPIPCQPFRFVGFLSARAKVRHQALSQWLLMPEALVFLESPHRIRATLGDIAVLSNKRILVGREMTKQFETFLVGSAVELLDQLAEQPKGEFVCVVEYGEEVSKEFELNHVLESLLKELSPTQASRIAAGICGVRKKQAYDVALQMSKSENS
jgi:16S rRNA (cytidine1402-2'-O)-methyltransferase